MELVGVYKPHPKVYEPAVDHLARSLRGRDSVFYETLDDDLNAVASLSYADFLGAYKAQ